MRDQVEEVKAKTDIVAVLSEYIDVKKAGKNYKALCPFHSEKTPSFMISQELQIYKCFGCGEGGDVFDFLQKYEGMDFYESLKHLAEKAGIKLQPLSSGQKGEKEKIYEINQEAHRFYHYLLTEHPVGKIALSYLVKDRDLKLQTINTFGLGYSPDKPFALKKYLSDRKKIPVSDLVAAGLVFMKEGLAFDRFRGRVIFPLHDHRGNILGFAGRILPSERAKDLAKYINSPETPVYHKSNVLYGLNIAKKDIQKSKTAVIVEGELDMISCWQVGVKNVAAIKGSALTQEQVKLLGRYAQSVVLALDADVAGDTAARRGIQIAEKEGLEIKVAKLGEYKDPDELARKDPGKLSSYIEKAVGVWDYLIDSSFSRLKGDTGLDKAKLSKELVPILSSISDNIVRSHYAQIVARRLGVSIDAVSDQIVKQLSSGTYDTPKVEESLIKKEPKSIRELIEERFLAVAFKYNPNILLESEVKDLIKTPLAKRIFDEFILFMKKNKNFDPSLFAGVLPKELVEGFTSLVLKEIAGLKDDVPESYEKEIKLIRNSLAVNNVKEKGKKATEKLISAEKAGDKRELKKGQEEFNKFTLELKKLEEKQ
jgi:DNA primase